MAGRSAAFAQVAAAEAAENAVNAKRAARAAPRCLLIAPVPQPSAGSESESPPTEGQGRQADRGANTRRPKRIPIRLWPKRRKFRANPYFYEICDATFIKR